MNRYIAFEGLDLSGKSTLIDALYNDLIKDGYKVMKVREPGETPLGKELRNLLLNSDYEISDLTSAYLFAADRSLTLSRVKEFLNQDENNIVLSDRSFISSYVYQEEYGVEANKLNISFLEENDMKPTLIFIDSTYKQFLERRASRESFDRIESTLTKEKFNELDNTYFNILNRSLDIKDWHSMYPSSDINENVKFVRNELNI